MQLQSLQCNYGVCSAITEPAVQLRSLEYNYGACSAITELRVQLHARRFLRYFIEFKKWCSKSKIQATAALNYSFYLASCFSQ